MRKLGAGCSDPERSKVEAGEARPRRRPSVTQQTVGLFKVDQPHLSAEQLRKVAEQAFADEVWNASESRADRGPALLDGGGWR